MSPICKVERWKLAKCRKLETGSQERYGIKIPQTLILFMTRDKQRSFRPIIQGINSPVLSAILPFYFCRHSPSAQHFQPELKCKRYTFFSFSSPSLFLTIPDLPPYFILPFQYGYTIIIKGDETNLSLLFINNPH